MPDSPGSEGDAQGAVDRAPCGLLTFVDDGSIVLINDFLLDLLGVSREQLLPAHIDRIFSPAGRIFYQTHFFPLLKLQWKVDEIYLSFRSAQQGEIPMLVSAARYNVGGLFHNHCVLLPMRDRHKLEEELLRAKRIAEEAIKIKDEFLAVVSHELRTPLTAMLGWLELLKHSKDDRDLLEEALNVIERNARAQTQLVSDILDISRIATGKMQINLEPIAIATVLKNAVDVIRPTMVAKNIDFVTAFDCDEASIAGDPGRLQQVFWNLLSNAGKFTPESGRIELRSFCDTSNVFVLVRDTGEGIPPQFLPHIFERFRQADDSKTRKQGGLGLGLAIVKDLVELHGGKIRAESAGLDKGSTFEVTFPRYNPPRNDLQPRDLGRRSEDARKEHPRNPRLGGDTSSRQGGVEKSGLGEYRSGLRRLAPDRPVEAARQVTRIG